LDKAMRSTPKSKSEDNTSSLSRNKREDKKERIKATNTIASKMKFVVEKLIQDHKNRELKSSITTFLYKSQQSEIISNFLGEMRRENPKLFNKREKILSLISDKYDDMMLTLHDEYPTGSRKKIKTSNQQIELCV
jgi:hypothetical protein